MRKVFTLVSMALAISVSSFAQTEMDAFNLSRNDLTGTARSVSMGGAFGALGGDAGGVSVNPAGIGVYKSHELVGTLNFTNTSTEANLGGLKADNSKFKFSFDNFAFVGVVPINSDDVPLINFGFAYNKLKSFDRKVTVRGENQALSLMHNIVDRANYWVDLGNKATDVESNNAYSSGMDWLAILGYDAALIEYKDATKKSFTPAIDEGVKVNNEYRMREKGEVSSYDFNAGTTISDIISIGATVSVTDIDYYLGSDYTETILDGSNDNYLLGNELKTDGYGWQLKAGVILKPVKEFRIGVAYHSPTWYNMTDSYYGVAYNSWDANNRDYYTPDVTLDYKLRTPDKWVFSLAGIIGQTAIISADYELVGYNKMKLDGRYDRDYDFYAENEYISNDFKNSSVFRVGAEIRFTPQFSGRLGYMWQESPIEDKLRDGSEDGSYVAATGGTIPQYSLEGDTNYFTWGLGYRFTPSFYTDVAFVVKNRTDDFYNYGGAEKAELKTNQFSGLLTLGYKF